MTKPGGGGASDGVPECHRLGCELIASSAVETIDLNADADVGTLMGALVTDRGCAVRVARACVALSGLDVGRQREILAAGGIESVLAAMDAHRADANVQQWGCIALQNVVDRNAAAKTRIAAAGGLTQIVSTMDSHSDHMGVQLAACQLLLNLSASMDLRGGIKAAGAGDGVRRAMSVPDAGQQLHVCGSGLLARLGEPEARQPCKPLRKRIGLGARRHERGEWKTLLLAPTTLHEQGRDSELDLKILRGDITADVRVYVLRQEKRIVSFLLSSTFTDTEWERNLLIDDVVPYIQDYARKYGFEFRLAEMRW